MGGSVALSLADRCRDQLVRIVLSEANLDNGGGVFSQSIAAYAERDFLERGFQEVIAQNRQASNDTWAASCAVTSPKALYRSAQSVIAGQSPSWRDILYSLDCPKTFVLGEHSLPDPNVQLLQDHGVHIEVVPTADHSMAWENPHGLAHAIRNGTKRDA
jgi:pimeloyl-ACP methyl ester carboxylesterase